MNRLLLFLLDKILSFRYFLNLKVFKSSIGEISSLGYKIHHLNAQKKFFWRNFLINDFNTESEAFNSNGFTTFSNKKIERCSIKILNKINQQNDQWLPNGNFKYNATLSFKNELIEIFENGVDNFLKSLFKSEYCILDHYLYKSERKEIDQLPINSQLWHSDGYPGIGINLLICHTKVNKFNGSMKIIKWPQTTKLLTDLFFDYKQFMRYNNDLDPINKNNRLEYRKIKCKILGDYINNKNVDYFQTETNKSGTIFAFNNNCVHAGGYTEVGQLRVVSLLHIYPSIRETSLEDKFEFCLNNKIGSFPQINDLLRL